MRIAQVAPLWEPVPPKKYGGTELIVGLLTDELVRRGHEVTLFASGDSETAAKLVPGCEKHLRAMDISIADCSIHEQMRMSDVFGRADDFDVIHCHTDYQGLPYAPLVSTPVVHTIHGGFNSDRANAMFQAHKDQNFVGISDSHCRLGEGLNFVATVYNAIATESFDFYPQSNKEPYLAFLGRLSADKGPQYAIEIAKRTGIKLKMAGKIDDSNEAFFKEQVEPHIDGKLIEFLGEADHAFKNKLMGGALGTMFTIDWEEPFGLVMIESMACGTPVIATRRGSVPEIVKDGETGFICDSIDECVAAVDKLSSLSRQGCRDYVESRFSTPRMVDDYEAVYRQLVTERFRQNGHTYSELAFAK